MVKTNAFCIIHCDNTTIIAKIESHYFNSKRRKICRKHNTVREFLSNGVVIVNHEYMGENLVEILKKVLSSIKSKIHPKG